MDGQGTATEPFTLTSVDGFTGTVSVSCVGPNPNLFPDYVLPDCRDPVVELTVPANGSKSGSLEFYPPWITPPTTTAETAGHGANHRSRPWPVAAGILGGLGLLGLRMRKLLDRRFSLLIGVVGLASLCGLCGCLDQGGLAMTPGTYIYQLTGVPPSGIANEVSANLYVTVKCNSCP